MGETAVLKACSDSLLTVAIAPHQIYGPRYNEIDAAAMCMRRSKALVSPDAG